MGKFWKLGREKLEFLSYFKEKVDSAFSIEPCKQYHENYPITTEVIIMNMIIIVWVITSSTLNISVEDKCCNLSHFTSFMGDMKKNGQKLGEKTRL